MRSFFFTVPAPCACFSPGPDAGSAPGTVSAFAGSWDGTLSESAAKTDALNPVAVLRRGFSYLSKNGERISSVKDVEKGDILDITLSDGEGIIFDLLTNPIEIIADEKGWVTGMKCIKMELGEPDESGRRRPVEVPGSEFLMELDSVIMSLGTSPNPLISSTTEGLETNKWKCIIADDENGKTTKEGVYAGGDAVTGAATVILAMGAGKAAAKGINEYLSK